MTLPDNPPLAPGLPGVVEWGLPPAPRTELGAMSIIDIGLVLMAFWFVGFLCGYAIGKTDD